jgi:patatin-like phospholipase/acyl hydrolase
MKKILSIDGGGMYGVVPAEWCMILEQRLGVQLADVFDLVVGTSTGSVLAGGIAKRIPLSRVLELYLEQGKEIFKDPKKGLDAWIGGPKYKGRHLRSVLERHLGADTPLGGTRPMLMITAYDMTSGTPEFFKSWKQHEEGILLVDAIAASSSAPTFHPMVRINDSCYVDGGVFAANPAMTALAEGLELWGGQEQLLVVSLGTGFFERQQRACTDQTRRWGLLRWAQEIPSVLLDGQYDMVDYELTRLQRFFPQLTYFRFEVTLDEAKHADETDLRVLNKARQKAQREAATNPDFTVMLDLLRSGADAGPTPVVS